MAYLIILAIWTVIALPVARALRRMCEPPPDPEPDWSAEDPRIIDLCERISRARAAHKRRTHLMDELRSIRLEQLRKQVSGRRA